MHAPRPVTTTATRHAARRLRTLLATGALLLLALATWSSSPASAASYWWSGTPSPGSNGFAWAYADAPYWNPWGATPRCESRGTTIPAGNPCMLTWHVPAGLDARAGSLTGVYKQANAAFEQRMTVECNGTTTLQGTAAVQQFTRQWPDMCGYLAVELLTPAAAATVSAASQYFELSSFSVELIDSDVPVATAIGGNDGWHGAGGACVRYAFSERGSGIASARLVNATTGAVLDAPTWGNGAITTGVTSIDRTPCMAAPAASGAYVVRASATDLAGGSASADTTVSFDVTAPVVGDVRVGGREAGADAPVQVRGSDGDGAYRPTITFTASDAHSGLAATTIELDGREVARGTSWQPGADLPVGDHELVVRARDVVGNEARAVRSFTVVDDVAPVLVVDAPGSAGGNEPVLDVSASDDLTGLDVAAWTVRVNGEVLVAGSDTRRLQAQLGWLVDATHDIEVRIADRAGNVAVQHVAYTADSGDDEPDAPGLTGLWVLRAPARVEEGGTYRVRALAVAAGRPVAGRYELRAGDRVLGAADASRGGWIDIDAVIDVPGPLLVVPPAGTALASVQVQYVFVAAPVDPCVASPLDPACRGGDGGSGGGGGGTGPAPIIVQVPVPTPAPAGAAEPGSANGGGPYPRDTVYYVNGVPFWNGLPLAESGAPADRVPPRWRLTVRREPAGSVRRTHRLALRLWTNELAVLAITPQGGARRYSANARRVTRTIHVRFDRRSPLGRRIAAARPGTVLPVRLRVVATDKNENTTTPRWITLRIRT